MSTPEQPVGIQAEQPAERALFRALFDDAAVFPPGLAPLPLAVADHAARRSRPYADLVGPLLLPAAALDDFLHGERRHETNVALIARASGDAGSNLARIGEARSRFDHEGQLRTDADPGVNLVGIEIGWFADWHEALTWGGPLICVEVPRGAEQERALADLKKHSDGSRPVRAKFRTGSTPGAPVPTPIELATFIRACVDHGLAFKLTGGLHHAISQTTAGGEDQFGFLNVIAATRRALADDAGVAELKAILSQRDPAPILDQITRMSDMDASAVRALFTAFGCCGVMDPIGDLSSLGLIKETTV